MKAKALLVQECTWTSEECHPVDDLQRDAPRESLCLPNIFRSKKVKPLSRTQSSFSHQVYYSSRELVMEVLDRGAIRELVRRAGSLKAGITRPSYGHSKDQSTDLSEEEYVEALTWISIVLQSGLSAGNDCSLSSDLTLKLDGWQAVLKRNSFQNNVLSLTRLDDEEKLEVLSAFCCHVGRRYPALYTPGPNLAVKKYRLSFQQSPCPLQLALLCDLSSGFICNMYLYSTEQLQRRSRKPVVEQVVELLLRPFCSSRHLVQLDCSAWMEGGLTDLCSSFGVNINFVPSFKRRATDPASSPPQRPPTTDLAHLQGWTGPALLAPSDPRGSELDVFLPGLWVALHVICINTFILHSMQSQSCVHLTQFTRTLASQLVTDGSVTVPPLPRLNSSLYHDTSSTDPEQRSESLRCGQMMETLRLQRLNTPGVCGLNNSGNSCYLNAALQCLCSTVPLVEHLLSQDNRRALARCRMAEVFVRLLEQMWLGSRSRCTPVEARSVLSSILPQFDNYSQHDAQELLLFLLNALHDNLKKVAKRQIRSSVQQLRQNQNQNCSTAAGESTIISHLFEGQLSYMTLCMHCSLKAHSKQPFTVLSLPIPKGNKCSIQDCLSLFFEQSVLSGADQMMCSVCDLRRETAVLTCLDKPPEILMLHLKRFGCKGKNQVKLRTNVVFPMKLDLTPFLSSSAQSDLYSSYRLYAVVNHIGHLNTGHYTALCHSALTQSWYCFDDSAVTEVQDRFIQSPNAYLLLYSRRPFQKPQIQGL